MDWEDLLKFSSLFYCGTTAMLHMFWQVMFLNNVQKTTQIQAYVLNNLTGSCCVILNLIFGVHPLKEERVGFALSVVGALLVVYDPMAKRADNFETPTSVFVALAFSSVIGAAYLLFNSHNTRVFRIFFLIFWQSLLMFVVSSLSAFIFG